MTNRKKKQDPKKDVPGKKLAVVKKVKTATRRSSRIMERRLKSNMSVIEKLPERVYEVQAQKKVSETWSRDDFWLFLNFAAAASWERDSDGNEGIEFEVNWKLEAND